MARRQRRTHQMLVPFWHVKQGTAAGCKQPFVAIGDEEIGVEGAEIEGDVADAVGAVDKG